MPPSEINGIRTCLSLTRAISATQTVEDIYQAALDALHEGLGVERASILLFDDDGVMRFKAWRKLSGQYRRAVEGHTPWSPTTPDPKPIVVADACADPSLAPYLPTILQEGIRALAFIPLVHQARVLGKFMLYYGDPTTLSEAQLQLAGVIAAQVAFAVARSRAEERARRSEARLRYALHAASMGTWDWDVATNRLRGSDNVERIHGLAAGTWTGLLEDYGRHIHPEDRDRVLASLRTAVEKGVAHDLEYRVVTADGTVRWIEGKGQVEYVDERPASVNGVWMDITLRKQAELARLEAANEASRMKDEFLAVLSHELRTPLNAVTGWVQLLEAGTVEPERRKEAMDVIGRNARQLAQLIDDILEVSRIVAGKFELEQEPLSVSHVVDSAVSAVRPEALKRNIRVTTDIDGSTAIVHGDSKRLQQVFGNLLSNALKFTPRGGRVSVQCDVAAGEVVIEVRDTGIGIEPEFLPSIFDRFRQADGRLTRRFGGLGLGLTIAKHLVELHGGSICADSEGPGRGAVFTVRLPASSAPLRAASMPKTINPSEGRLGGVRIMVVDDDEDARNLLQTVIRSFGARAMAVDSAGAALEVLRVEKFDFLVADIAMPEMDGYELVRRAKAHDPQLISVALTARARAQDRTEALEAGFDAYESKPFNPDRLIEAIVDLRARRRSMVC